MTALPAPHHGGMATSPMPAGGQRAWVQDETRRRSMIWPPNVPASNEAQIGESAALAIELYETAAAYRIDSDTVHGVTSFIDAAIDMIRARDRS